jgi:hypothetical protein
MTMTYLFAPLGGFLLLLLAGWRFPDDIAQPLLGHHAAYGCLMEREG